MAALWQRTLPMTNDLQVQLASSGKKPGLSLAMVRAPEFAGSGITDQPDRNTVNAVTPYILQTPSQTVPDSL
jgi:hypothetical protein